MKVHGGGFILHEFVFNWSPTTNLSSRWYPERSNLQRRRFFFFCSSQSPFSIDLFANRLSDRRLFQFNPTIPLNDRFNDNAQLMFRWNLWLNACKPVIIINSFFHRLKSSRFD